MPVVFCDSCFASGTSRFVFQNLSTSLSTARLRAHHLRLPPVLGCATPHRSRASSSAHLAPSRFCEGPAPATMLLHHPHINKSPTQLTSARCIEKALMDFASSVLSSLTASRGPSHAAHRSRTETIVVICVVVLVAELVVVIIVRRSRPNCISSSAGPMRCDTCFGISPCILTLAPVRWTLSCPHWRSGPLDLGWPDFA